MRTKTHRPTSSQGYPRPTTSPRRVYSLDATKIISSSSPPAGASDACPVLPATCGEAVALLAPVASSAAGLLLAASSIEVLPVNRDAPSKPRLATTATEAMPTRSHGHCFFLSSGAAWLPCARPRTRGAPSTSPYPSPRGLLLAMVMAATRSRRPKRATRC